MPVDDGGGGEAGVGDIEEVEFIKSLFFLRLRTSCIPSEILDLIRFIFPLFLLEVMDRAEELGMFSISER